MDDVVAALLIGATSTAPSKAGTAMTEALKLAESAL